MKKISRSMALCGLGLSLLGCAQEGKSAAPRTRASAPASSEQTKPKAPAATSPLAQRLAQEANSRPAIAVHVEQLASALAAQGVTIARTRQVLASPLGARYCATLVSQEGLGAALCEFESEEAATQGERLSLEKFEQAMPGRVLTRNGNTLLTLSAMSDVNHAQTVLAVFTKLKAGPLPES